MKLTRCTAYVTASRWLITSRAAGSIYTILAISLVTLLRVSSLAGAASKMSRWTMEIRSRNRTVLIGAIKRCGKRFWSGLNESITTNFRSIGWSRKLRRGRGVESGWPGERRLPLREMAARARHAEGSDFALPFAAGGESITRAEA